MKKIVAFLTASSLMTCSCMSAYAGTTSVSASLDPDTGIVSLSGSAVGTTTIRVIKSDVDIESLNDNNMPTDLHQITTKGTLDYKFQLPDGSDGGRYYVSVTDKNGTSMDTIFFFDKGIANSVVNTYLSGNLTETEFVNTVLTHADDLGIDIEHEDFSNDCLSLMYRINSKYTNFSTFYSDYVLCRAISAINHKDVADVENYLKKYENTLGINYSENYENNTAITAEDKVTLCKLLSAMDYSKIYKSSETITGKTGFSAVFDSLSALAAVSNAQSWKGIEKIYTTAFPFLKSNVVLKNPDYKASDSVDVFGKMLKMEFNIVSDLKDNFDNAVKSLGGSDKPHSSGGSGGSLSVPSGSSSNVSYEDIPSAVAGEESFSIKNPILAEKYAEFWDVHNNDWFYAPVSILAANGIVNGYSDGGFYPNNNITRAEFTKLIVSAFSVTGKKVEFTDVNDDAWYKDSVSIAAGAGIVAGYDGCFNPDNYITRQDAVVILYRVAKLLNKPYEGFDQNFSDADEISLYALTAVGALNKNGIVSGVGNGRFMPLKNISRAEAVQLIYNVIIDIQNRA